ncbi:FAD-dependent monooxygenase [Nocardia alba]|uniref:2-polyprenyl-6-methoxyphenol hydroxylase-like FAD-dependent oxidoreductase n=1 Tax=Nocardia alba TaxID=225051 RepID=A0A4R1FTV8_9NOCA|nr:FAD-dependent monooxygenase [Nocardia alba]TCJ97039.1 2-polyprenyl-6-methoxyphenol hydroxylase-like FAD-dependent oxidoreductase [Nocardia alba]
MSITSTLRVLVSGGGIAGNAVALQLLRNGIHTTVIERAATPRPGGQAVDLRGPSKEAVRRMGLMEGIAEYRLDERGMSYIDGDGKIYARMAMADFDGRGAVAEIEITRGDLNQVLLDALATADNGRLDYRYGEWIEQIVGDDNGVDVTFASGATERFDLVIGADGVHSATRRLVFGPEEQFSTNLGGYGAFFTMPKPADVEPGWFSMRLVPGAMFGIRPDADPSTAKAIITVRTETNPALRRDVDAQRALISKTIGDAGWHAPAILAAMDSTPDFYFDEVARVDVPELSVGRVTLIGDAGYCGSPLSGMGTAMAIVGAYILAAEVAATPDDLPGAQRRYQDKISPFLDKAKEIPGGGMAMMIPKSALLTRLAKANVRLMMSRPMRPLTKRVFFGHTEEFALPTY